MTAARTTRSDRPVTVTDPRLLACLDSGAVDIGTVWELCMHFEFDREATADGIAGWLGPPDGSRILDCACGGGFPALDLVRRGYDLTCTDGSEMMLAHFRHNARTDGVSIEPVLVPWDQLPNRYDSQFDVVMNRGGGNYRYAGVWDDGGLADRQAMADAIAQWVACVRPGGRFYIDITRAEDSTQTGSRVTRHPTLLIGEHTVENTEEITVDRDTGLRTWRTWLTVDGVPYEFQRQAHHLDHEEFVGILAGCGLVDVRQVRIPGEFYDVFCAIRP